ncbi:unnamed protein product [Ambrosiozyma monospora]|uniref:Unnamed protein product n=1 Tax=Ambrosiozyma monospora TaxID=43982 RepID=A0ACB5UA16_AMBMO|nr:unnamed protein product [Ambrosiozyma monospora]
MEACKTKVSNDCENLVTRIDDIQDAIEALKLDLSKRGARPSPKQITMVGKEKEIAKTNLQKLNNYMASERKNWNAKWQTQLTAILEEQEFFKEQETIIGLLEEDLNSAEDTYDLIVKCVEEMEKSNPGIKSSLSLPVPDPTMSTADVRNALLEEVAMLKPDHESRVEAIAKAEKLREKEKVLLNTDEFQEELGDFVGHDKLKKSGGVEELERMRQLKDQENLKSSFGIV